MKRIAILLFLAAPLMAQKDAEKPKTPPAIPLELRAKYFKAQTQAQAAQTEVENTPQYKFLQAKRQSAIDVSNEIQTLCGENFVAQLDKDGDPACVAKPEPPKAVEPVKK